jgi:hypothetical protein
VYLPEKKCDKKNILTLVFKTMMMMMMKPHDLNPKLVSNTSCFGHLLVILLFDNVL